MMQHVPEERLALYVTGDLDAADIREHLQACEDCRKVAAGFEQTCAMMAGTSDEPAQADLAEVRNHVRKRLKQGRPRVWKWAASGGIAAAAAIAFACFTGYFAAPVGPAVFVARTGNRTFLDHSAQGRRGRRPQDRGPAPQGSIAAANSDKGAYPSGPVVAQEHHIYRRPAPGIKSVALIDQPNGPPLIKITTTDPHVLILLASDERTKTE